MKEKNTKQDKVPLYTIGITANLVGVCPATLRIWERKGLISPGRIGKNRYYTNAELHQLKYIKSLLREKGANLAGVKEILRETFCWDIKNCKPGERHKCPVYRDHLAMLGSID